MQHNFFKNLTYSALFSGSVMSIFLILTFLIYKNPLNSVPKGLDMVLFIALPIGALLLYKFKVNQGFLDFKEAFVLVMLTGTTILLFFCITIWILCSINPEYLGVFNEMKVQEIIADKKVWLERVKTEQDYQILLQRTRQQTVGMYLFGEIGIKLIIISLISLVSATGFRKSAD
jgi:hypothetical protein